MMHIKQGTEREDGLVFYGKDKKGLNKWVTKKQFESYRERQRQWRLNNKEKARQLVKDWFAKNKDRVRKKKKEYLEKNPEKKIAYYARRNARERAKRFVQVQERKERMRKAREDKLALKEKLKQAKKEERIAKQAKKEALMAVKPKRILLTKEEKKNRRKAYFQRPEVKERIRAKARKRYATEEGKKKLRESKKRYFEKYPDKKREANKKRYLKVKQSLKYKKRKVLQKSQKMKSDPLFAFKERVRSTINKSLKRTGYTKKSKSLKILGCSWEEFYKHIESKFTDGMNWNNRGMHGWHIDHIIPLAIAKTEEEIMRLNHYTNLQPLWGKENMNKKDVLPDGREARNVNFSDIEHLLKKPYLDDGIASSITISQ